MNILLINGSPKGKKSNTLQLSMEFCEGIRANSNVNIEILELYKLSIKDCKGCFVCWKDTPGKCCIQDDMEDILEKIKSADILIGVFLCTIFLYLQKLKHFWTDNYR